MLNLKKILSTFLISSFFCSTSFSVNKNLAYDFSFKEINGKPYSLNQHKGKVLLIVNVASQCGFVNQYEDLQDLYDEYQKKGLVIIGLPSNDFGSQEPGTNKEIKDFCETKFGITFPMMEKINITGDQQDPFFKWAINSYGSSALPKWNFYKILINKNGQIVEVYNSLTNPKSQKITKKLKELL